MPYYQTKNYKQRLIGFASVVILHILLIYVLIVFLEIVDRGKVSRTIELKFVDIVQPEDEIMLPVEPSEIKTTIPDYTSPPDLSFEADTVVPANVIRDVQHVEAPAVVNPTFAKARRSSKGLTHPAYPEESARLGEQGTTELNLNIAADGNVVDARVLSSSGSARLDQAIAAHALRYWKFIPCKEEGVPVSCWHPFTFQWNIENAKKKGTWRSVVAAKND